MRRTGNSRHVAAIAGEESVARTFVIIRAAYRLMPSLHVGAMSVAKVWPATVAFKSFSRTRAVLFRTRWYRPLTGATGTHNLDLWSAFFSRHRLSLPWNEKCSTPWSTSGKISLYGFPLTLIFLPYEKDCCWNFFPAQENFERSNNIMGNKNKLDIFPEKQALRILIATGNA